MDKKPIVFEYDDYRRFLKDTYLFLKARHKGFSFRAFSRAAGLNTPNFLKLVMDGNRNLGAESIEKFSKAFKLNKEEATFFRNLVLFNQSKTNQEKQDFARELITSRSYKKLYPLKASEMNFFSHWYFIPLWELVGLNHFQENPEWIGKRICPSITVTEVKFALGELLKLGLLVRTSEGRLVKTKTSVSSDNIVASTLTKYHQELITRSLESIERFPRGQREISAHTFKFSSKSVQKVKEMVHKFRMEVLELASQEETCDIVSQLNIQFFPVAVENPDGIEEGE